MDYDIKITAAVAAKLGEAARNWPPETDVELAADDRMTVAVFDADPTDPGLKVAWDTDGSLGSDDYLTHAPLDPTGTARTQPLIDALRELAAAIVTQHEEHGGAYSRRIHAALTAADELLAKATR